MTPSLPGGVMQRLLRGWGLYAGLGALILWLYVMGASAVQMELMPPPSASSSATLDWWPSELDHATLVRLAHEQPQLAVLVSLVVILSALLSALGLALTVHALANRRLRAVWRFPGRPLPTWTLGEVGRIMLLTLMIASLLPFVRVMALGRFGMLADFHLWLTVSMLFLDGFVILLALTMAAGKGRTPLAGAGFPPRRSFRSIATSLAGYIGVFPWIFLLLFLVAQVAKAFNFQPPVEPIHDLIFREDRADVLTLTVVLACLVGPVAEELFFRGVLYAALRKHASRWLAIAMSGAVFAFVHTNIVGFLPIMALGCVLAYLYERTGSLAGPIVVHVLHNTLLMSSALLIRRLLSYV